MPIYEYRCLDCNEKFEKLVLSSAKAKDVECPRCHSRNVKKELSLFGKASSGSSGPALSSAASCSVGST